MIGKLRVTILGAAVAIAAFGVGGSTCHAQAPGVGASVNANIDVNALVSTIQQAVASAQNRDGFVQTALDETFYKAGGSYNVMVCNMNLNPDDTGLQGVQFFQPFTYSGIPYGIWVFESGKFVKPGDGGYINWAFRGKFQREPNSGTVTFFK